MPRRGRQQPGDARLPLGRMFRITGMQVVFAAAGMGVDEQQALVLARQRIQDFEQHHVFVDVGEVAGVILMAIFHGTPAADRTRLYTVARGEDHAEKAAGNHSRGRATGSVSPRVRPTQTGIAPPTRIPDPIGAVPAPAGVPVASAALPREVRRAVVADAAQTLQGSRAHQVVLVRAEQVTWSDGSLGCPEPGRQYAQMLVPGFRVVAKTASGERVYHTDSRAVAVSCTPATVEPDARLADKPVKGNVPRTWPPPPAPPDR